MVIQMNRITAHAAVEIAEAQRPEELAAADAQIRGEFAVAEAKVAVVEAQGREELAVLEARHRMHLNVCEVEAQRTSRINQAEISEANLQRQIDVAMKHAIIAASHANQMEQDNERLREDEVKKETGV